MAVVEVEEVPLETLEIPVVQEILDQLDLQEILDLVVEQVVLVLTEILEQVLLEGQVDLQILEQVSLLQLPQQLHIQSQLLLVDS